MDFIYWGCLYYADKNFTCNDCGKTGVWTAQEQQWCYEVAKRSYYSSAPKLAAELRHPCRKCLPSSIHAGSGCIIFWLVNVFRLVEQRRRPARTVGASSLNREFGLASPPKTEPTPLPRNRVGDVVIPHSIKIHFRIWECATLPFRRTTLTGSDACKFQQILLQFGHLQIPGTRNFNHKGRIQK